MDCVHYWLATNSEHIPIVEKLLIAFLEGTLPAWRRFSREFHEGSALDTLTPAEKLLISIPPTNDANESILGGWRVAEAAYKRNNTEAFADAKLTTVEDELYVMQMARAEDASGAMRKFRDDLLDFKNRVAAETRKKQDEKAAEAAAEQVRLGAIVVITDAETLAALPVRKKGGPNLREQLDVRRELWKNETLRNTTLAKISKKADMLTAILAADQRRAIDVFASQSADSIGTRALITHPTRVHRAPISHLLLLPRLPASIGASCLPAPILAGGMAVEPSLSASRVRRRSLKVLLQIPGLPRAPAFAHNGFSGSSTSIGGPDVSLPEDIVATVVDQLDPGDILSLSLTSSHLRALLGPALYRTVHLRSSRTCASGLRMLAAHPELCAHVRELAVRPNYYLAWPARDTPVDEEALARSIARLAPTLKSLRTFVWDGREMPPDALWRALRTSCPDLTELFSNVGYQPLDPASEQPHRLLPLRAPRPRRRHTLPPHDPLPPALWTMLLERCPALAELTLCSFSAAHRLLDLAALAAACWPALTVLTLGAFGYTADFTLAGPPAGFDAFLAAHLGLATLRLAWAFKRWMSPDELPPLPLPTHALLHPTAVQVNVHPSRQPVSHATHLHPGDETAAATTVPVELV
ncbi:hypothetical protein B0H14DRAFT_3719247 [Mycena olivaceomarginata]|nr:hypothetical protein B0H14DRAFT_3719247 [Mycena olivaceomarginata]